MEIRGRDVGLIVAGALVGGVAVQAYNTNFLYKDEIDAFRNGGAAATSTIPGRQREDLPATPTTLVVSPAVSTVAPTVPAEIPAYPFVKCAGPMAETTIGAEDLIGQTYSLLKSMSTDSGDEFYRTLPLSEAQLFAYVGKVITDSEAVYPQNVKVDTTSVDAMNNVPLGNRYRFALNCQLG